MAAGDPDKISELLRILDKDGNCKIAHSDLSAVFQALDPKLYTPMSVTQLFRAAGINEDNPIDIKEFLAWIYQPGAKQRGLLQAQAEHRDQRVSAEGVQAAHGEQDSNSSSSQQESTPLELRNVHMDRSANSMKQQLGSEWDKVLDAAQTIDALVEALDRARPHFAPEELQRHQQRLDAMLEPFTISVLGIDGQQYELQARRQLPVAVLLTDVAAKQLQAKLQDGFSSGYRKYKLYQLQSKLKLLHMETILEPPSAKLEKWNFIGPGVQLNVIQCEEDLEQYEMVDQTIGRFERRAPFETLPFDVLVATALDAGFLKKGEAVELQPSCRDRLIERFSFYMAAKAHSDKQAELLASCQCIEAELRSMEAQFESTKHDLPIACCKALSLIDSAFGKIHELLSTERGRVSGLIFCSCGSLPKEVLRALVAVYTLKALDAVHVDKHRWTPNSALFYMCRDMSTLEELLYFDKYSIPDDVADALDKFIDDDSTEPNALRHIVGPEGHEFGPFLEATCLWLRAMHNFHRVSKCHAVEIQRVQQQEQSLEQKRSDLEKLRFEAELKLADADDMRQSLASLGSIEEH